MEFDVKLFVILFMAMSFDWIFQSDYEAVNKTHDWKPRLAHSITVASLTALLVCVFGYSSIISYIIFAVILLTHFLIDDRKLVRLIMLKVHQTPESSLLNKAWIMIVIDQWLHMLVNLALAVAVCYLTH